MYSVQGIFYVFQDDLNVQRAQKEVPNFSDTSKPPEVYVYQRLLSNNLPLPVRSGLLSTTHIRTVSATTRALLVVLARLLLAKHRLKHQKELSKAIPSCQFPTTTKTQWLLLQLMHLSCRPHCRQTCSRPQTNWLIYVDLIAGHPSKGTNAANILLSQAQITICASTIRKIHESWVLFPPMMNISIKKRSPGPSLKKGEL